MAKDGPGGEKTEKPTPQRLKKARKEGQIPRTQELGTWAGIAAASVLLPMIASRGFSEVQILFVQIRAIATQPDVHNVTGYGPEAGSAAFNTTTSHSRSTSASRVTSSATAKSASANSTLHFARARDAAPPWESP